MEQQGGIVASRVALRIIYIHTLPDFNTKDDQGVSHFRVWQGPVPLAAQDMSDLGVENASILIDTGAHLKIQPNDRCVPLHEPDVI